MVLWKLLLYIHLYIIYISICVWLFSVDFDSIFSCWQSLWLQWKTQNGRWPSICIAFHQNVVNFFFLRINFKGLFTLWSTQNIWFPIIFNQFSCFPLITTSIEAQMLISLSFIDFWMIHHNQFAFVSATKLYWHIQWILNYCEGFFFAKLDAPFDY